MSKESDLEYCIQKLSCDDTSHHQQQCIEQQKLVADLQQQLEQQKLQIEQQQLLIEQQQQQLQIQQLEQLQIRSPKQPLEHQQTPFQIVLIDIKQAANRRIHCVQKPLMGYHDLKYVAVSYRWGELHETTVKTGLDYTATVTSFRLNDLFALCEAMTKETDLQYMDYVWVDAICVDQSNYQRRKATIYQMTNIYHRANYIMAVPDLHLEHLVTTSALHSTHCEYIFNHSELIFQLLHGNGDQLVQIDYNNDDDDKEMTLARQIDKLDNAMNYLIDLTNDWASRAWVISEYSIGKKKNKIMKYWFIQLNREYEYGSRQPPSGSYYLNPFSFFEFDFSQTSAPKLKINTTTDQQVKKWNKKLKFYYYKFHSWMLFQLGDRQFLEIILKSKASKHEDRFHAVLPLLKYKHMIENKDQVESWKINNLISVKLKLYEFMDTHDKLKLLFLSGSAFSLTGSSYVLPTFATSTIRWPYTLNFFFQTRDFGWNFDLSNEKTIHLDVENNKLNMKPIQYFKGFGESSEEMIDKFWTEQDTNGKQFGFDETLLQVVYIPMFHFESTDSLINEYYENTNVDLVQYILLVGHFESNIWFLHRGYDLCLNTKDVIMGDSFGTDIGFDIY